ncbi:MAG: hypothetical protein H0W83_15925 [Planctomycetes bacterium]|nr:hypothetical protein [Planctomycetota bacterium]
MPARRKVYQVEFTTSAGVRLEFGSDGWRVLNIRQLGERDRVQALELLDQVQALAEAALVEPFDRNPLLTRAEHVSTSLGLRITHRRSKEVKDPS